MINLTKECLLMQKIVLVRFYFFTKLHLQSSLQIFGIGVVENFFCEKMLKNLNL